MVLTKKYDKLGHILLNVFIVFCTFEVFIKGVLTLQEESSSGANAIKIGILLFMIFAIVLKGRIKGMTPKIKGIMFIYLVFFIVLGLKILSINQMSDLTGWLSDNNNLNYIFSFVCFIIILNIDIKKESVINTLIVSSTVVMVISFIFFIKNNYYGLAAPDIIQAYSMGFLNKTRMLSIFASPNHAGLYFVMVYLIVDFRSQKNLALLFKLYKFLLIVCIMLTLSRTAIGILLLYIIIKIIRSKNAKSVVRFGIISLMVVLIGITLWVAISKYNVYFFSASYIKADNRWIKWQVAIEYIKKYWEIGAPFNIKVQMYAYVNSAITSVEFSDNLFLEIASRFGVPLIACIFIFMIKNLRRAFNEKKVTDITKILVFIISSITTGSIHFTIPMILFIVYCDKFE
ncbi:hypothetical protein NL50_12365 [Clostridium acetobutylicum]|nr:hypothetical protein NL50_12365 [Clostridium acetobutylicum]